MMNSTRVPRTNGRLRYVARWLAALCVAAALSVNAASVRAEGLSTVDDARATLDAALHAASEMRYDDAIGLFELVQRKMPDAIESIDGLKIAAVRAIAGDHQAHERHSRWLSDRYKDAQTATDAERSVKGYVIYPFATDPALLAHAGERTRYAVEQAAAAGEDEYLPWFYVSLGIAEYRLGNFHEAATWTAKSYDDENPYIRGLALAYGAMAEDGQGNAAKSAELLALARTVIHDFPKPGAPGYEEGWTDTIMAQLALNEAEASFEPIFNGENLDGWSGKAGIWRVEDGHIVGENPADAPIEANTFLIWQGGKPGNFELKFRYKIDSEEANSGVQVRSEDLGDHIVAGPQPDIATVDWITGIHYEERGRGIMARRGERTVINAEGEKVTERFADEEKLGQVIRHGDWNDYHVIAKGNSITAIINGHTMNEVVDDSPEARSSGVIAFQIHTGPPMQIRFTDIELKRLDTE